MSSALEVPAYRMLLPSGWEKIPADRQGVEQLMKRTSSVFRDVHRPDLDAQMRTMLEVAYRKLKSVGARDIYLQTQAEGMPLPMSIISSIVSGTLGQSLDRQVTALFREKDAAFLRDDRTIVRWRHETAPAKTLEDAQSVVIDYLIPVPDTARRNALQLTTTIPVPSERDDEDQQILDALVSLSDTLVSTFMWESEAR